VFRLEERKTHLRDSITTLEKELCSIKSRLVVAETNIKEIYKTLDNIRNNTTWILRLMIGSFFGILVNLIFKGGL
jgi:hypothetical protein